MTDTGSASQGVDDERERGMSPSTSQQWDFETLSMLSQPATIEEILEEPEKHSCWQSVKELFSRLGALGSSPPSANVELESSFAPPMYL